MTSRIEKTTFRGAPAWIKYPEDQPSNVFALLHKAVSWISPAVLRPAQSSFGIAGLAGEAERLQTLRAANLPVPEVLEMSEGRLVLSHEGTQLRMFLKGSRDPDLIAQLLRATLLGLHKIHQSGFCHGRPSLKDIVINEQHDLCFLDLEEDPCAIMSLPDAQARDVWLLLASCAEFCPDAERDLTDLLNHYRSQGGVSIDRALLHLARAVKPYQLIIDILRLRNRGRDIKAAYWAMKTLDNFRKRQRLRSGKAATFL